MHGRGLEAWRSSKRVQGMVETQIKSTSSPSRGPGTACHKSDAQATYKVGLGRSIYGGKDNFIKLPMALVSP
jgi:hypothetical protein